MGTSSAVAGATSLEVSFTTGHFLHNRPVPKEKGSMAIEAAVTEAIRSLSHQKSFSLALARSKVTFHITHARESEDDPDMRYKEYTIVNGQRFLDAFDAAIGEKEINCHLAKTKPPKSTHTFFYQYSIRD